MSEEKSIPVYRTTLHAECNGCRPGTYEWHVSLAAAAAVALPGSVPIQTSPRLWRSLVAEV